MDESDPLEIENEDEFLTTGSVTTYDWQRKFYDVEHDILFDIILAANYLDIKSRKFY